MTPGDAVDGGVHVNDAVLQDAEDGAARGHDERRRGARDEVDDALVDRRRVGERIDRVDGVCRRARRRATCRGRGDRGGGTLTHELWGRHALVHDVHSSTRLAEPTARRRGTRPRDEMSSTVMGLGVLIVIQRTPSSDCV